MESVLYAVIDGDRSASSDDGGFCNGCITLTEMGWGSKAMVDNQVVTGDNWFVWWAMLVIQ